MIVGAKKILQSRVDALHKRTENLIALENRFFPSKSIENLLDRPLDLCIQQIHDRIQKQKLLAGQYKTSLTPATIVNLLEKLFADSNVLHFSYDETSPSLISLEVEYQTQDQEKVLSFIKQIAEKQPVITELADNHYISSFQMQKLKVRNYVQ